MRQRTALPRRTLPISTNSVGTTGASLLPPLPYLLWRLLLFHNPQKRLRRSPSLSPRSRRASRSLRNRRANQRPLRHLNLRPTALPEKRPHPVGFSCRLRHSLDVRSRRRLQATVSRHSYNDSRNRPSARDTDCSWKLTPRRRRWILRRECCGSPSTPPQRPTRAIPWQRARDSRSLSTAERSSPTAP